MTWRSSISIPIAALFVGCASACITEDPGSGNTFSKPNTSGQTGPSGGDDSTAESEGESDSETGDTCRIAETTEVEGCPAILGEGFCTEGGSHVEQDSAIEWSNNPPHSGDHYPTWKNWGEHDEPVPRGNWVHNLEHGGVALIYNCPEGCDAELELLRAVFEALPDHPILMTEDPLLDGPRFAAVSWNWVLEFDAPDVDELVCFVEQHYDHAPESVF